VMTLARPELLERRPDWGAGKRNFFSMYLEPLSEPSMRALLAGLVPGLPEGAARSIVSRADGVPLYAVETVRMLVAQGRLAVEDGVYRPAGDLTTLAVPETLTALIASRLDGLAPGDRTLVSDAAVLGQSFTIAALGAVSGIDPAALEPRLRGLVRRELLTLEADPRSPERGQYAFVQALIREVAYNTLARSDRKVRHIAAARFFEGIGSDELAGALAGHYLAGHANAAEGPEADALGSQARIALDAAAERAAALGSHEQAVTFLRQALTVTTDPADVAALLERAGESASNAGHHDEAEVLLRSAVERLRALGDRPAIAQAISTLGRALLSPFRTEQALAVLEPAAEEFADLAADPGVIAILGQLSRAYMLNEEPDRAIQVANRALAAAERADLVDIVADTLVTLGSAYGNAGRAYQGRAEIQGGLDLAERHGLVEIALRARLNLGALPNVDPAPALQNNRRGLAEARRLGLRRRMLLFLTNGAEAGFWTGDWDWALPELDELLAADLDEADRMLVIEAIVRIRGWQGQVVDVLVDELEGRARVASEPYSRYTAAVARADLALAHDDLVAAAEGYRRAAMLSAGNAPNVLTLAARSALLQRDAAGAEADLVALEATGTHGPWIDSRRESIQAGLAALYGRPADALGRYAEAFRRFRDLGVVLDEALTAIEMATLLDPDLPEVPAAGDAARVILTRLRAQPFLERLETAMAGGTLATVRARARPASSPERASRPTDPGATRPGQACFRPGPQSPPAAPNACAAQSRLASSSRMRPSTSPASAYSSWCLMPISGSPSAVAAVSVRNR
jgi:tetratricopeptide (TPR) repeat protein